MIISFFLIGKYFFSCKKKCIECTYKVTVFVSVFSKDLSVINVVDFLMVTAAGPLGGGRIEVPSRLLRHFNIIAIETFTDDTLRAIFSVIMDWHFSKGFEARLKKFSRVSV